MPRDIPVGNGSLLITHDQDECLRDIYYPSIGKENHTDVHGIRPGLWADGEFAWVNRGWNPNLGYLHAMRVRSVFFAFCFSGS
jgi:glucoamylase